MLQPALVAALVAFVDVTVVPMDRPGELPHQTVVVRDGRIAEVGPAARVTVPPTATRIDGRGRWLIPGLCDMHVHLTSPLELPLYLANGVTTVFNLDGRPAHVKWRRAVAAGKLLGPTIYTAGPMLNVSMSSAEAVRTVDAQADAGYDAIKIYNGVGAAEYPSLIAEAKRRRLLLMGHVAREPGYEATVAAGQSIAHMEELTYTFFHPRHDQQFEHIEFDERRIPVAVQLAAKAGISITPTLTMFHAIVRQATELRQYLENPELAYLPPWLRAGLEPGANRYDQRYTPTEIEVLKRSLAFQRLLTRAMSDAGVPLLAGTDATAIGPVAGFSLQDELGELVASGLLPWQALRAATVSPARYFGRSDAPGTVAAGARADLVLLDGDPLAKIAATRQIAGVMAGGRWLDARRLQAELRALPDRYAREHERVLRLLNDDPARAAAVLADDDPLGALGAAALLQLAKTKGAAPMLALVRRLRAAAPDSELAGEGAINTLGYALAAGGQLRAALAVLEDNVHRFPRSANARDSWGEILARAGDTARAVAAYRAALAVDPHYVNAEGARRFIDAHTTH